ncbi:MAG: Asd/ArgC dimerization domain-containing protein, partial [Candidatus Zophobacter franzmannii]|nr:Asd/ArgC dimerization domain-containing protein [Candidatus Zophobacter franzmannii]
ETIYCEFEKEINLTKAEEVLNNMESVVYLKEDIITPLELDKANDSYVCRLRYGVDKHSLNFWNVGDNIRIGAAVNAVRILKKMQDAK